MAIGVSDVTPDTGIAISRTWFAFAPDGSTVDVTLSVGIPYLRPHGEWAAVLSLGELEPAWSMPICGVDGWQAVHLAMLLAKRRIEAFEAAGWRFFWTRGGDAATAAHLGEFANTTIPPIDGLA